MANEEQERENFEKLGFTNIDLLFNLQAAYKRWSDQEGIPKNVLDTPEKYFGYYPLSEEYQIKFQHMAKYGETVPVGIPFLGWIVDVRFAKGLTTVFTKNPNQQDQREIEVESNVTGSNIRFTYRYNFTPSQHLSFQRPFAFITFRPIDDQIRNYEFGTWPPNEEGQPQPFDADIFEQFITDFDDLYGVLSGYGDTSI